MSKIRRLSVLVGAFLLALSVTLAGCGSGVSEEGKKEAKEEAEKKEMESKDKQEKK